MRFKSNDGDTRFSLRLVADNAAQPSPELQSPTRSESSSPHNNKRTRDDVNAAQQSTPLNFDTSYQEHTSSPAPAAKVGRGVVVLKCFFMCVYVNSVQISLEIGWLQEFLDVVHLQLLF